MPQFFIKDNHEPIITREQGQMVREIYEYRRKQMGIDDSGKYQNRYVFSSNIICGECGGIFRRQKIYIGKPYEKIQWCCSRHIEDKSKCSLKGIREDVIKRAFTVMWNKLTSNYIDILIPLLESLKSLRIDEQQEQEISECNNRIMELTEQSHILSRVVQKGYMDSALFYEKNNDIGLRLLDCKRRKALLHSKRPGIKEIASTERLIRLLQDEGGAAGRVPG